MNETFVSNKRNLLLALIIVAALGLGWWMVARRQNTAPSESSESNVNVESETTEQENTNAETEAESEEESAPVVSEVPEPERPAAIERDTRRLADIKSLRDALAKYFTDNESYPEKLEELVPSYLSSLPADPLGESAKVSYTYTPIGSLPATYYDLGYYMEVGVEGLQPIEHDATPDNLTIMQEL